MGECANHLWRIMSVKDGGGGGVKPEFRELDQTSFASASSRLRKA